MNDADQLELPTLGPEGLDEVWDQLSQNVMGQEFYSHYDRSGNPISMRDWMRLRRYSHQHDECYVRVAADDVGDYWVSTVWVGMNHNYGAGPPLIFETMVFRRSTNESDLDCWRYPTEAEALAGHARAVAQAEAMLKVEQ